MRISLVAMDHGRVQATVAAIVDAEAAGFDGVWLPHYLGADALTVLGAAGAMTSRITLGSSVVPARGRHPVSLWQQARTTAELAGGRLVLGIGAGHDEWAAELGIDNRSPGRFMREFLGVLDQLARTGATNFEGSVLRVRATITGPDIQVPVFIAALGPQMVGLAAELAGGVVTWLADEQYIENVVLPTLAQARHTRRPRPKLTVQLPACIHDDAKEAQAMLQIVLPDHEHLTAYRRVLDRAGHLGRGPEAVALVGTEDVVAERLDKFAALGVDEVAIAPFPVGDDIDASLRRTRTFFAARSAHSTGRRAG